MVDFKDIDKKYRARPFWSWNDKLNPDETRRQLWYFMKKIILREFDQKWAQYFA